MTFTIFAKQAKVKTMLSIIIPTYNERENIEPFIKEIQKTMQKTKKTYEIIIIDDNSPDGTSKIVKELIKKTKDTTIRLYTRPKKQGLGSAYKYGFKKAKGTMLMEIDADFSHDPKEIPNFIKALNQGNDAVIGSRGITGGERNDPMRRKIFPMIGTILYKTLMNCNTKDITSGYRLYKKSALDKINLNTLPDDFSFQVALLFALTHKNCKIKEIPIKFNKRRAGEPKYSTKDLFGNIKILIKLYIKKITHKNNNP